MKATLDIPDDLYRRVKAKAAMEGLAIREVTTTLYRSWLGEAPQPEAELSVEAWLADWTALGQKTLRGVPPGPTATEILARDRSRLDRDP